MMDDVRVRMVLKGAEMVLREIIGVHCLVTAQPVNTMEEIRDQVDILKLLRYACAREFMVSEEAMVSDSRKRQLVDARKAYCFLAWRLNHYSLKSIGVRIGGRDHTSIIHLKNAALNLINTNDTDFINKVKNIISTLGLPTL